MKKSYFPESGVWLKGNPHSHTTVSDGKFTPEELAKLYESKGYAFLSMTDHNILASHNALSNSNIIMLTGLEHDIEYNKDKCIHIVGLTPIGKEKTQYPCKRYSPSELNDNQLVDMMREDGQFVSLAHPIWSRMELEEIYNLNGYHAIEVYNNGTEHLCHGGNAEIIWDMLLRHGKRVFATACDDVHTDCDLFGGWICAKAAEHSPEALMAALFSGAFYSSCGPEIFDFGTDNNEVYLSCSDCREIHFVTYPPRGESFFTENGEPLTEKRHKLSGREAYVRAVCVDSNGRSAWTNPIFFDEQNNI